VEDIAKLERIYILKEFYDLKLGYNLFEFNRSLARENNQKGIWLFVWKGNERAIKFYKKNGFEVIGNFDYKISETHSNPNYQMFLKL
jgi:ribosomal protein S18 acetylase RimI-like enzyme